MSDCDSWPRGDLPENGFDVHRNVLSPADLKNLRRDVERLDCLGVGVRKPPLQRATVQAVCWWKDKRRPDGLNVPAALKPVFDGLTDAKVWVDDKHVDLLPVVFHVDKNNPRLEISVWEAQAHYLRS